MYSVFLALALTGPGQHCATPKLSLPEPYPGAIIIIRPIRPIFYFTDIRPFPIARLTARGIGYLARRAQRPVLIPIRLGRPHLSFRAIR